MNTHIQILNFEQLPTHGNSVLLRPLPAYPLDCSSNLRYHSINEDF